MRAFSTVALTFLAISIVSQVTFAAISGLQRVASGLSAPMFVTHAPGDTSRLFIAQRGGAIRILDLNSGSLLTTAYYTIPSVDSTGEGGFLGLAFHPDFSTPLADGFGKFYAKYTQTGSPLTVRVREFTVANPSANVASVNEAEVNDVLSYTNPDTNHIGGWIGFSPNHDYLYIANGDGGGGNDPENDAQTTTTNWLGKMLRVDPLGDDFASTARNYSIPPDNPFKAGVGAPGDDVGLDEIWAYGLRNPFRASFDRLTGDMWIGDVGQGAREEIDFQPADSTGGENYGWRLREGSIATPGVGGTCSTCVDPVYDYERPITGGTDTQNAYRGTTVIGGYIYRGPDPSLQGQYFFLDRNAGTAGINYWRFEYDPDVPNSAYDTVENIDSLMTPNTGSAAGPVSMGEDAKGNLYIAYFSGEVYRIHTNQLIPGDYNADGVVDDLDTATWSRLFRQTGPNLAADGNRDGVVDGADYVMAQKLMGTNAHGNLGAGGSQVPEPAAAILFLQAIAGSLFCGIRHRS